ncbi:MAG TPA: hypothetical protein VFZ65_05100 [Planctomycetota bacterium]|nr:hypothetical protein [Planctomycetota bacterium]
MLLAALPPLALVAVRASMPDASRLAFLARLLYWTMPIVLALAVAAWLWRWRAGATSLRTAATGLWPGAVAAVLLTVAVSWLVPAEMRVQFDETSLVGCSQNMHGQRAALMTTGAVPFEGEIVPIENVVDKRPPLFAFLTSLLHDVSGYRIANAFAVNAGLLALGLLLVFAAARARLPLRAALAAPFALLAVPLTSVVATSAGFDLLAAVLFLVVLLAALDFVRQPDTVRFVALLAGGVLFAQSRYESLPALLLAGGVVLYAVRGRWRPDRGALLALAACPVLLTPLVLLLLHARDPMFYPEARGQALVSVQHFAAHLPPMLAAWFWPCIDNALPGIVAFVALPAWSWWLWRGRSSIADAVVLVPVFGVTALVLCWFFGDVHQRPALRLFLPLAWLTALAPLLWAALVPRLGTCVLAAMVVLCGVRLHAVQRGAAFARLPIAELTDGIDAMLLQHPGDARTTLWVSTAAQHLIVEGRAALSPRSFLARQREVLDYERGGHVRTIYVLTTPLDAAMAPAFGDPAEVLARRRSVVEFRIDGPAPITVHRLVR